VPAGALSLEAVRGFGYTPAMTKIDVRPGVTTTATLQPREFAPRLEGWYSGDTHAHDLHQGPLRADPQDALRSVGGRRSERHQRPHSHGRHAD
jgi:hypothetical protein